MERMYRNLFPLRANLRGMCGRYDRYGASGRYATHGAVYPAMPGMRGYLHNDRSLDEPGFPPGDKALRAMRRRVRPMRGGLRTTCAASSALRAVRARMPPVRRTMPTHERRDGESGLGRKAVDRQRSAISSIQ